MNYLRPEGKDPLRVTMIMAQETDGLMGINNELPWRIPFDMRIFKEHTMGKCIIMGRNTFESMGGRELPGRHAVVVTSSKEQLPFKGRPPMQAKSVEEALLHCSRYGYDEAVIIGGMRIYRDGAFYCHEVLVTEVHTETEIPAGAEYVLAPLLLTSHRETMSNSFESGGYKCTFRRYSCTSDPQPITTGDR